MTLSATDAIKRAEAALRPFQENYAERLEKHLGEMQSALDKQDLGTLAHVANEVKGEAGTMGWPLVSQAAGWLRQLLEAQGDEVDLPAAAAFMQSLTRMYADNMVGESEEGVILIKELYALTVSRGVEPV